MHVGAFVKGAMTGAAAAYLLDPVSGGGRRARLRDQAAAATRRGRVRADKLSRHATNVAEGKISELGNALRSTDRSMDDATVADRIRSEVLGRQDLQADGLVVNVESGVAFLRGEMAERERIEEVVELTAGVAGVTGVENLVHLPESPAPNKAAARAARGGRTAG